MGELYVILFLALFVTGEAVLIPTLYAALAGWLNLRLVLLIAIAANVSSDLLWYSVGRSVPMERLRTWPVLSRRGVALHRVEGWLKRYGLLSVFMSKFVYGTRTVMQILAGSQRLNFLPYFFVNLAGLLLWTAILFVFVFGLERVVELL